MEKTIITLRNSIGLCFFKNIITYLSPNNQNEIRNVRLNSKLGLAIVPMPKNIITNLAPNETLVTRELKSLIFSHAKSLSYRDSAKILTESLDRNEKDLFKATSIENFIVKEGNKIREIERNAIEAKKNSLDTIEESKNLEEYQSSENSDFIQNHAESLSKGESSDTDLKNKLRLSTIEVNNIEQIITEISNVDENKGEEIIAQTSDIAADNFNYDQKYNANLIKISMQQVAKKFIKDHNNKYPDLLLTEDILLEIEDNPLETLYFFPDDILSKHQNEHRAVNGKESIKSSVNVVNSNIYTLCEKGTYAITADNCHESLIYLDYYRKYNNLTSMDMVCISDGAKTIKSNIINVFGNTKIIWDYVHLRKKTKEQLSKGLKNGKKRRSENLKTYHEIMRCLWFGKVDNAISIINGIEQSRIKNKPELDNLIKSYLDRKENICCYALRKTLNLPNSSSYVESLNYSLVGKKQKHKGASWGYSGSHALAAICCLFFNRKMNEYLHDEYIPFKPDTTENKMTNWGAFITEKAMAA